MRLSLGISGLENFRDPGIREYRDPGIAIPTYDCYFLFDVIINYEIRYLGIYIERSVKFCCNLDHAKRSFYRAVNGIL